MPLELSILLLGGLLVAIGATLVELRASLAPVTCPECPHCRRLAQEALAREERDMALLDERIRDAEPRDEDRRRR
jgi:hypothetical protein